jgi:DNA-binding beta-propeller fold protein YncE
MGKYRYWGMIGLLGAGLALTLAGCGGGGSGSSGGHSSVGSDPSYSSSAVVTTLAGSGSNGSADNVTGTSATFNSPTGLALNSAKSYLYVADTGNSSIRRIYMSSEAKPVTTFYSGVLSGPEGLVFNGSDLYVCDTKNSVIRSINSDKSDVSIFVSSDLNCPTAIILSGSYFYVADSKNNVIRRVLAIDGTTNILAGSSAYTAGNTGSTYGETTAGTSALFNNPYGVTTDGDYLYITDSANSTIRKIEMSTGAGTILAGIPGATGYDDSSDGTGQTASFNNPTGIAYYSGALYVADTKNHIIRKVNASNGDTDTIAGYKGYAGFANETGNATKFSSPTGIISDGAGTLYVADTGNNRIRKIELNGM